LILFLLVTALKLAKGFSHEDPFRRVIFALVIMLIVANYTETHVLRLNVLWFAVVFASFIPGRLLAEANVRARWERFPRVGSLRRTGSGAPLQKPGEPKIPEPATLARRGVMPVRLIGRGTGLHGQRLKRGQESE
jgi:hypothetical protein